MSTTTSSTTERPNPRDLLQQMFAAAIEAAQPAHCIPPHLPEIQPVPSGRLIVVGAGKASAAMARAVEDNWPGPLCGLVVTRYGYGVPCTRIEIVEAAHPVPDAAGLAAAGRICALVSDLTPDDTVLCLISGGGSSLLVSPLDGITLEDKQAVSRALLKSGAVSYTHLDVYKRQADLPRPADRHARWRRTGLRSHRRHQRPETTGRPGSLRPPGRLPDGLVLPHARHQGRPALGRRGSRRRLAGRLRLPARTRH